MTLEQWSFIAQIISAIAVIASLIFVGFQLRRATEAIRAASSDAYSVAYTQFVHAVVENGDFADIWARGLKDPGALTDVEWIRFIAYVSGQFRLYDSSRVQWLRGRLDDEHWYAVEHHATSFANQPGFIAAWKLRGHWHSPEFRAWFDGLTGRDRPVPYERATEGATQASEQSANIK
ncbi:MAG TPA: hypothetical protein VIZ66_00365 [Sphingomicrobium sp.]